MKRFLSYSGGVQSTTVAHMILDGVLPRVDAFIFADTYQEKRETYRHIWMMAEKCERHGMPLVVCSAGDLGENIDAWANGTRTPEGKTPKSIPLYTANAEDTLFGNLVTGRGRVMKQCTYDYKLMPLWKTERRLCGLKKGERANGVICEAWICYSKDEADRVKPSTKKWAVNVFPLLDLVPDPLSFADCVAWMSERGYEIPPRSACEFCPAQGGAHWRELRKLDPSGWERAIARDEQVRTLPNLRSQGFLHSSLKPLPLAPISERDGFAPLCEGGCGL